MPPTLDEDPELTARVLRKTVPDRIERIMTLRLGSFDWKCPQHIMQRFSADELRSALRPVRTQLAELEAANVRKRERLHAAGLS